MVDSKPNRKVRKRLEVIHKYPFEISWDSDRGSPAYPIIGHIQDTNQQMTVSEGHTWPPPKKFKGDVGGDFLTERTLVESKPTYAHLEYKYWGETKTFRGFHDYVADAPVPPAKPSDAKMDAMGTTAIARVDPTKSVGNAATFLGELFREGLPSLMGVQAWKDRTNTAKASGGEYLNYQFGWAPMVSEVRKFAFAVKNAERILKQYQRDEGRLVRRRYDFPLEESVTQVPPYVSYGMLTGEATDFGGAAWNYRELKTSTRWWFSGAFQYWIPDGVSEYQKLNQYVQYADKILGLELTPEVLWNLAPWSWAVDWFSNAGDVIHNVSAFDPDRLVMRYGYIMCNQKVVQTVRWDRPQYKNGTTGSPGWRRVTFERKSRRRATPFGFGLNLGSLSNYQWSILAALGMTKGPKLL